MVFVAKGLTIVCHFFPHSSFQILIRACDSLSGNKRILEVLSYVKQQIREKVRFHAITQMILKESHRVELTVSISMRSNLEGFFFLLCLWSLYVCLCVCLFVSLCERDNFKDKITTD